MLLLEVLPSLSKAVPESVLASIARVTASHGCLVVHVGSVVFSLLLLVLIVTNCASRLLLLRLPWHCKEVAFRMGLRMLPNFYVGLSGRLSSGGEGALVLHCILGKLLSN